MKLKNLRKGFFFARGKINSRLLSAKIALCGRMTGVSSTLMTMIVTDSDVSIKRIIYHYI